MRGSSFPTESGRQTRRPKVEVRKKPETRRPNPAACLGPKTQAGPKSFDVCAFIPETMTAPTQPTACSGLRTSAFFRPSALGFRISRATRPPTETARGERCP